MTAAKKQMFDERYQEILEAFGVTEEERSAANIEPRDLTFLRAALIRTEHSRRCDGFYNCTCIVGKADEALKRIEEAIRAAAY